MDFRAIGWMMEQVLRGISLSLREWQEEVRDHQLLFE